MYLRFPRLTSPSRTVIPSAAAVLQNAQKSSPTLSHPLIIARLGFPSYTMLLGLTSLDHQYSATGLQQRWVSGPPIKIQIGKKTGIPVQYNVSWNHKSLYRKQDLDLFSCFCMASRHVRMLQTNRLRDTLCQWNVSGIVCI